MRTIQIHTHEVAPRLLMAWVPRTLAADELGEHEPLPELPGQHDC